jgi:hypothetical protein
MRYSSAGKGHDRRGAKVSKEMEDLRWGLLMAPAEEKGEFIRKIEDLKEKEKEGSDVLENQ